MAVVFKVLWQDICKQLDELRVVILALTIALRSAHIGYFVKETDNNVVELYMVLTGYQTRLDKVYILEILGFDFIKLRWSTFEVSFVILVQSPLDH